MITFTATAQDSKTAKKAVKSSSFSTSSVLVGNTIPNLCFAAGCYNAGMTQAPADTKFCQIVKRGLGSTQHLAITKKFWNQSDWNTSKNDLQNYAKFGTTVIMCLQPALPGTQADLTNLANFLTTVKGFGFSAANCYIVLWQEPEGSSKNLSPSAYQTGLAFYGPAVVAAGLPLVCDIGTGAGPTALANYGNAAVNSGIQLAGLAQDYYCPQYVNAGQRLGILPGIADGANLPFGIFEHGCVPSSFSQAQCTAYMTHIHDFMLSRLQSGKPCLPVLYYDGQCSAVGANDLTSPIGQDPSVTSPDFRIALWQDLYDDLCGI
jgi:hypothetical protein